MSSVTLAPIVPVWIDADSGLSESALSAVNQSTYRHTSLVGETAYGHFTAVPVLCDAQPDSYQVWHDRHILGHVQFDLVTGKWTIKSGLHAVVWTIQHRTFARAVATIQSVYESMKEYNAFVQSGK